MKQTDVLILGGLSGITAGMSCRKFYPDKKVTLVRKEGTVLIPCGIPYIFGTVGGQVRPPSVCSRGSFI